MSYEQDVPRKLLLPYEQKFLRPMKDYATGPTKLPVGAIMYTYLDLFLMHNMNIYYVYFIYHQGY